jgi:SAM-dependent methyltransferase
VGSGDALPFGDGSFDLVTQAMAVSSILDPQMRIRMAAEMWRVAKPGGLILWYDLRYANPWNPDMRPVGLKELALLFPTPPIDTQTLTLLPPLARRLAGYSQGLCRLLERLAFLRSHRLALFRKQNP